jgi:hypothetical protein
MSYELTWYREKRILLGTFNGIISPNDLIEVNDAAAAMIREGTPPVHDIINALALDKVPFDLKMLNRSMQWFKEPNLGWVIVIAKNPMFGFFGSILSQAAGKNVQVVSTWDEALAILAQVDSSLGDLTSPASTG